MCTILVIEKNDFIRENTSEMLELHHYHVLAAKDASGGWEQAELYLPHLIFCDNETLVYGKKTLLEKIRGHPLLKASTVFCFTTVIPTARNFSNIRSEPDGFLQKPFLEEDLLWLVGTSCAGKGANKA